jgi:hypothetical protein
MDMGVNESGDNCFALDVQDFRILGYGDLVPGADGGEFLARDDDHGVIERRAAVPVDQPDSRQGQNLRHFLLGHGHA